ncbi:methylated-DNA--[protein]-cysteine S-methyltransferase [Algoriphagus machipongonensis]|uniref:Methylated-DNA--protein-cysteine methyltransferase n=1 Tax=Algoriphagus machipongonensis TaxID=388413 RepID=A3I151_9BACT|nr:methylated-DNA--[protein]-cysteine S-methyltransferase [Algoriphagus machipongonensis]EAZ80197.1 methylated-DNA--protein-cysteine methyltransferase [Algoriphagus machipongonensis]
MPIIVTSLGNVLLEIQDEKLTRLQFTQDALSEEPLQGMAKEVKHQLDEYLSGKRKSFDLPLELEGTDFQKSVWKAVNEIPFGQTTTYMKLSQKLGNVAAIRAVGAAIGANPVLVIVPCHRIIGTDGKLTGYAGGLERKQALLEIEGFPVQQSLF